MKTISYILAVFALVALLGVAGTYDWAEEIIYPMPIQIYDLILEEIGNDASDVQIAKYYVANKERLDSIASW